MKNVILILTLILCSVFLAKSQDEKIVHLGFNVTPKITQQVFEDADLGVGETLFGFGGGLDIYYDVSNLLQLKTGLQYNYYQVSQIDYSPTFPDDNNGNGSVDIYSSWLEDIYKIHYLGVPVEGRLKVAGEENHIYAKAGIEALFKVADMRESYIVESQTVREKIQNNPLTELQNIVFKAKIGIGYEFKMADKMKLYVEPQLEYSLTGIYKEAGIIDDLTDNSRLLDVGLMMGVRF